MKFSFSSESERLELLLKNGFSSGRVRWLFKDICVCKKDSKLYSFCQQDNYDYDGIENALINSIEMKVKTIIVYKLIESEEILKEIELEEKNNKEKELLDNLQIQSRIKNLFGFEIDEELFNSDIHTWNLEENEFISKILFKSNVVIVIEGE